MNHLPKAKLDNIVVQNLKHETLIYNLVTNQAFCLNETAAQVFNACDGATSFDELKENRQLTDEIIFLALDGLKKENLIFDDYVSPFAGLSRREVVRRVGLASLIVLPVVSAMVAPQAAHAASIRGCLTLNQCYQAGTVYCPPGCNGTYNFVVYDTRNGTCGGTATTYTIDCTQLQGQPTPSDIRRIS